MFNSLIAIALVLINPVASKLLGDSVVQLASHSFSLEDRYGDSFVNDVFKDNILLTLNYLDGAVKTKEDISWDNIEKPFKAEFSLQPGQAFAFHDQVLPEYKGEVVKTTNAHFNYADGFKSDGYLTGDGVCHLASIIYWVAKDAGLTAYAPVNHDFAVIPEVPKEYGVAIYAVPGEASSSSMENLYIVNDKDNPVTFVFNYDGTSLTVSVVSDSSHKTG